MGEGKPLFFSVHLWRYTISRREQRKFASLARNFLVFILRNTFPFEGVSETYVLTEAPNPMCFFLPLPLPLLPHGHFDVNEPDREEPLQLALPYDSIDVVYIFHPPRALSSSGMCHSHWRLPRPSSTRCSVFGDTKSKFNMLSV